MIIAITKFEEFILPLAPNQRLYYEEEDPLRTSYQRDRDRIIHSRSFRRLKHKTQVFVSPQDDHPRTRLTHTIEVSQIARTLAYALSADENLTEAIALAHDLGHPPFGHAGEKALNEALSPTQNFNHNIQTLRILTSLERRCPEYSGLNLTKAVIAGTIKHSFPIHDSPLPYITQLSQQYDLDLTVAPMIAAQIASVADDIAYNHHDLDDGLRAKLFSLKDVGDALPFTRNEIAKITAQTNDVSLGSHMFVGTLIGKTITDIVENSRHLIKTKSPENHGIHIKFSVLMYKQQQQQKRFLYEKMYQHPEVLQKNNQGAQKLKALFQYFITTPNALPETWQIKYHASKQKYRLVADYIAGMTDNFANLQFEKINK